MDSLNRTAIELVDEALEFADDLNVGAVSLENDATVVDFGVDFAGGLEAGLLLTEIQTAGLATVQTTMDAVAGTPLPHVELFTDQPALALLGSQTAGWELAVDGYEALGSGPARALRGTEPIFQTLQYRDEFDLTALVLEANRLPEAGVAEYVADETGIDPAGVYLSVVPATSIAGTVSAAARVAEVTAVRLYKLGYDPTAVHSVSAVAPVPPVAATETTAIARGSSARAYGGQVHLVVEEDSELFADVPSTAGTEYGLPFSEIFDAVDWNLDAVEQSLFGPAVLTVDVRGGPTRIFGSVNETALEASFDITGE